MTGGRACSICRHPEVGAIQRAIGEGVPLVDVCSRFEGIKKSALHRHMTNHTGRPTEKRASRPSGIGSHNRPGKKSLPDGRCPTCLQLVGESSEALTNEQILKRAERNLHISESVAINAQESNDARLALLAVDRTQRSIEMFCKIAGLLGPDTVVNVDARTQNLYAGWPTASLLALQVMHDELAAGKSVQDALHAVSSQIKAPQALSPGRSDKGEAA